MDVKEVRERARNTNEQREIVNDTVLMGNTTASELPWG